MQRLTLHFRCKHEAQAFISRVSSNNAQVELTPLIHLFFIFLEESFTSFSACKTAPPFILFLSSLIYLKLFLHFDCFCLPGEMRKTKRGMLKSTFRSIRQASALRARVTEIYLNSDFNLRMQRKGHRGRKKLQNSSFGRGNSYR